MPQEPVSSRSGKLHNGSPLHASRTPHSSAGQWSLGMKAHAFITQHRKLVHSAPPAHSWAASPFTLRLGVTLGGFKRLAIDRGRLLDCAARSTRTASINASGGLVLAALPHLPAGTEVVQR